MHGIERKRSLTSSSCLRAFALKAPSAATAAAMVTVAAAICKHETFIVIISSDVWINLCTPMSYLRWWMEAYVVQIIIRTLLHYESGSRWLFERIVVLAMMSLSLHQESPTCFLDYANDSRK